MSALAWSLYLSDALAGRMRQSAQGAAQPCHLRHMRSLIIAAPAMTNSSVKEGFQYGKTNGRVFMLA